jgi:hypothetical protein
MNTKILSTEAILDKLQFQTFSYFWNEANPEKGLVAESSAPDCPASTAVTGLALTGYPVAVERGFISRNEAVVRTLSTLRFFNNSRHGQEPEATGFRGFYYQLLDIQKGRRAKMSELSVFDTSVLIAGALAASAYFDNDSASEYEIRELAESLYRRVDWNWALAGGKTLRKGWKPETGFSKAGWKGYDEALIVYLLALGSPSFPIPEECYEEWTSSFRTIDVYGFEYLYAGPLFIHQIPHIWLDMRNIQDSFMNSKGYDYFQNSTRATFVHRQYAIDNPLRFEGYGKKGWGLTRCEGPGPCNVLANGEIKPALGYEDRGVPFGPDDGTISPWASVCSLPFASGIVLPLIEEYLKMTSFSSGNAYGFKSAFNPSIPHKIHNPSGWKSPWNTGIIQGPALPLIENYRSGFLWNLMKDSQYIISGLKRAGFRGGWLNKVVPEFIENDRNAIGN